LKIIKLSFLFILVTVQWFYSHQAIASAMIMEMSGEDFSIKRDGYPVKPGRLLLLKTGDIVEVSGDSRMVINHDQGRLTLDASNTPYKVPEEAKNTRFTNSIKVAISRFRDLMQRSTTSHVLISRGIGDEVALTGVESGASLVPENISRMRLFLEADALSRLIVKDHNGRSVHETDFQGGMVEVPLESLSTGVYELSVEPVFSRSSNLTSMLFKIVSVESIPADVRSFISKIDSPEREKVAAVLLSDRPGWKLSAIQYAYISGDNEILSALLSK